MHWQFVLQHILQKIGVNETKFPLRPVLAKARFYGIVEIVVDQCPKFFTITNEVVVRFYSPKGFANLMEKNIGLRASVGFDRLKNPKQRFLDFVKDSMNMIRHDGQANELVPAFMMPIEERINNDLSNFLKSEEQRASLTTIK